MISVRRVRFSRSFVIEVLCRRFDLLLFYFFYGNNAVLYYSRGSFLTINSVLTSMLMCQPTMTLVTVNKQRFNISYTVFNEDLLLIAIAEKYATLEETKMKTLEIIRYFEFTNRILPRCFVHQNIRELDIVCHLIVHLYKMNRGKLTLFEASLMEPHFVPLPKEAQLRIDDALGEMEAMDYREWVSVNRCPIGIEKLTNFYHPRRMTNR